jgi:bifunctional non-homologous end joining protein LigD
MVPMAATLTQDRFTGPEWVFERKYDGIRLLAFRKGRDVRLLSRNQLPQNLPSVRDAILTLDARELIIDGELAWSCDRYHVFDVLWLDGRDLTGLPLMERLKILKSLRLRAPLRRVAQLTDDEPWERACAEGWEGVIAKRRDSKYEHRRSPHWLKMKCEASQELVVGGFTEPQGSRVGYGALLVGYYDGDDFVFAGKVGTSQGTKELLAMRARLDKLEIPKSPFTRAKGLPRLRAHWAKPEIVVQVSFIEWTKHDKLRHSRLIAIRSDKKPQECIREAR